MYWKKPIMVIAVLALALSLLTGSTASVMAEEGTEPGALRELSADQEEMTGESPVPDLPEEEPVSVDIPEEPHPLDETLTDTEEPHSSDKALTDTEEPHPSDDALTDTEEPEAADPGNPEPGVPEDSQESEALQSKEDLQGPEEPGTGEEPQAGEEPAAPVTEERSEEEAAEEGQADEALPEAEADAPAETEDLAEASDNGEKVPESQEEKKSAKKAKADTEEIKETSGALTFADKYEGQAGEMQKVYTLTSKGVVRKNGIKKIEFLVYPETDTVLQKWYTAEKQSDGSYTADVAVRDFKKAGQYKAEVYVTENNGTRVRIKRKEVMNVDGILGGTVTISSRNPAEGRFVLKYTDTDSPSGASNIKFGVYTKEDKSDAYNYVATKQSDGSYRATVKLYLHNNNYGTFHVNVLGTLGNGIRMRNPTTDVRFTPQDYPYLMKTKPGRWTVGLLNPSRTEDMKFAVWCETDGKEDLKWYPASLSGKRMTAKVVLYDHREVGTYHMQAWSGDTLLGEKTFEVRQSDIKKNGWVYEKGLKYYYIDGARQTDLRNKFTDGPFHIAVNRQCNTMNVFAKDGSRGFIIPIYSCVCSVGEQYAPTPRGVFRVTSGKRWKKFETWDTWVQYAVRYAQGRFLHSCKYYSKTYDDMDTESFNNLGNPGSHGCIRLTVMDSRWVYEHMKQIREVRMYDSATPGPFGAVTGTKIPATQTWDPTDPLARSLAGGSDAKEKAAAQTEKQAASSSGSIRWEKPTGSTWSAEKGPYGNTSTKISITWNNYVARYYKAYKFGAVDSAVRDLNVYVQVYGKNADDSGFRLLATKQIADSYSLNIDSSMMNFRSGNTYQFRIRIVKKTGDSYRALTGYSDVKSVFVLFFPTSVRADRSGKSVTITWNRVNGASGYYVLLDYAGGKYTENKRIATLKGNGNVSYTYRNLKPGQKYVFAIQAWHGSVQTSGKAITIYT